MGVWRHGWHTLPDGFQLPWHFNTDSLHKEDWDEVARLIAWKFSFSIVAAASPGGLALHEALLPHCEPTHDTHPILIVDDQLVLDRDMEQCRRDMLALHGERPMVGVVLLSRGKCPNWVFSILTVNEWSQSRATGLG